MTASAVLRKVRSAYPDLFDQLPGPKLRLVREAIVFAARLSEVEEVLSPAEHERLLERLTGVGALSPGRRLRAYRVREDLSQVELARRCGIPQANLSAMESGRRPIGLQVAKRLAKTLGCDYRLLV